VSRAPTATFEIRHDPHADHGCLARHVTRAFPDQLPVKATVGMTGREGKGREGKAHVNRGGCHVHSVA